MKRRVLIFSATAGVVTLLVALAVSWLLLSKSGLQFLAGRLVALAPVPVQYESVQGHLLGDITITGLRIADAGQTIFVAEAQTELVARSLLRGQLNLSGLDLRSVRLETVPPETPAPADEQGESTPWVFPEPQLPVDLLISNLVISDIGIEQTGEGDSEGFSIRNLSASAFRYENETWSLTGMQVDADGLTAQGDVSYRAGGSHDITISLNKKLQLNDKYIEISSNLTGDNERLSLVQSASGLVSGKLSGELLDPAGDADWSLQADFDLDSPQLISTALPSEWLHSAVSATLAIDGKKASANVRAEARPSAANQGFVLEGQVEDLFSDPVLRNFSLLEQGGPTRVQFDGKLRPLGNYPTVDGRLSWSALRWPLQAPVDNPDVLSPAGAFEIQGESGRYRIDGKAEFENDAGAGTLATQGELNLAASAPTFSLTGDWDALQLRVAARDLLLQSGQYRLAGDLEDYRFTAGFAASTQNSPEMAVQLGGQGSSSRLEVNELGINSAAGSVKARGAIEFGEAPVFELQFNARDVNTGAFDSRWPGRLAAEGNASGQLAEAGVDARIGLAAVRGQLRGQALDGRGEASVSEGALVAADVSGTWGKSMLRGKGKLGQQRDFSWQLNIPELSAHTDRGSGSVTSSGSLLGTPDRPDVQAQIVVNMLRYEDVKIEALEVAARISPPEEGASSLQMLARDVVWKNETLGELDFDANGTVADHAGRLKILRSNASLETRFSGRWSEEGWRGEIGDSVLQLEAAEWKQDQAASLLLLESGLQLDRSCLVRESSRLCLTASYPWQGAPDLDLAVTALPLAEFAILLPRGLSYAGIVSGEAQLASGEGNARFAVADARIWQEVANEEQVLLEYAEIVGTAELARNNLSVGLQGVEAGQSELRATALIPFADWAIAAGPLQGRVQGTMENLSAISFLFPDLADLRGRLTADLQLRGTVARPLWEGEVSLADGEAQLPTLGLNLKSIGGRVRAAGGRFDGQLDVSSGSGSLRVSGQLAPDPEGATGKFNLAGEDFLASDLPEARVVVSPEMTMTLSGRSINLNGKVMVDEARIEPRDLTAAVQRSPDARVMAAEGVPAEDESWAIVSKVAVSFGDQVFFKGFGLESRIAGALTVTDAPDTVTTATGELETVDGTYEAYGRKLEIRRGRLLFSGGPLANPGLDVLATRKIDAAIEVGVVVRATLKSPEVVLYSDPSMASSQTLSYLLVGQPLADLGNADRQLVNNTATQLASAGGGLLAQQLGRRLGLEEVSVTSGAGGEQAALVIGKYLSPKLYASYGIGLFEPINTLRLRYLLSSKWTIRAESGLSQSIDLEYALER